MRSFFATLLVFAANPTAAALTVAPGGFASEMVAYVHHKPGNHCHAHGHGRLCHGLRDYPARYFDFFTYTAEARYRLQ